MDLNIYSKLEDKWYALLDKIDTKIPVYNIIDPIDNKVPSFALFLAIIIILIIIFLIVPSIHFQSTYQVEISVLSKTGLPLENAKVTLNGCSGPEEKETDAQGKVSFITCSNTVLVQVSKKGYSTLNEDLQIKEKITLRLSPNSAPPQNFVAKVKDGLNEIISDVTLSILCDGNVINTLTNQTANGFSFLLPPNCETIQLRAEAVGYETKNLTIKPTDERVTMYLQIISNTGKIIFNTNNTDGPEPNVEITVTSSEGQTQRFFTDSAGTILRNLSIGNYTYNALSRGELKNGNFTVETNITKDVFVFFENLDSNTPLNETNLKYINLKIVNSSGLGIPSAEINIYKDGNAFANRNTNINGGISAIMASETYFPAGTVIQAVIKKMGYETKIVGVTLLGKGETQTVTLEEGGGRLKVLLVNDKGDKEKNAFVSLRVAGFNGLIDSGNSDINGSYEFRYLPAGTYSINAMDKTQKDEAFVSGISLAQNESKIITIVLRTGEGKIRFELVDKDEEGVNASYKLHIQDANGSWSFLTGRSSGNAIQTSNLKVGTKVKLEITDGNFIPFESMEYTVTRGITKVDVFLIGVNDLPNNNLVQMFLLKVYSNNPLQGNTTEANKLMPGLEYYLYFDLILNNETSDYVATNFFTSPKDLNILENNPISIEEAYSITGYTRNLSSNKESFFIDPNGGSMVNGYAKQANVLFANVQGKKSIPIVIKIKVDENAEGEKTIYWQTLHGENLSLEYNKEFTIGETFCFGNNCPTFLFSNYLKHGTEITPIPDDGSIVFIGENYKVLTTVENLSDEDFGQITLGLSLKNSYLSKISIGNDTNQFFHTITLGPLINSSLKETIVNPKQASGAGSIVKINEEVQKIVGNTNVLETYSGSDDEFRLRVKNKEELIIMTAPNTIDTGVEYPFFIIKTRYKGREYVPAQWKAEKIVGETATLLTQGQTDENGIEILSFSALNLSDGDVVRFTAEDENGSIPGILEITVGNPFPVAEALPPECISITLNGTDISTLELPMIEKDVNAITQIIFDSNCTEDRLVFVHSDLPVTPNIQFNITPGEQKTISVKAKPRGELLGAYPVQILANVGEANYREIGLIDIVISDPNSCFDLNQAIFDFRTTGQLSAKVFNNCFTERRDAFYPQMNINTNSVALDYAQEEIPETYSFTAKVTGRAMESFTASTKFSDAVTFKHEGDYWLAGLIGDTCKHTVVPQTPSSIVNSDGFGAIQEMHVWDGVMPDTDRTEPDLAETDPTLPFYALPTEVQGKIVSELYSPEGSLDDIVSDDVNLSGAEKEKKISFGLVDGTQNSSAWPNDPSSGQCAGQTPSGTRSPVTPASGTGVNTPLIMRKISEGLNGEVASVPSTNWCDEIQMSPIYGCGSPPQYPARYLGGSEYELFYSLANDMYTNPASPIWPPSGYIASDQYYADDEKVSCFSASSRTNYKFTEVHGNDRIAISFGNAGIGDNGDCTAQRTYGKFYLYDYDTDWLGLHAECDGEIRLQTDSIASGEWIMERRGEWAEDFNISNITEGTIYDLGSYEATPSTSWASVDTINGHTQGESWIEPGTRRKYWLPLVHNNGFIPWEFVSNSGGQCGLFLPNAPDQASPLIEYDSSGLIEYEIDVLDIPPGLRMFLKNGHVYAEYIGRDFVGAGYGPAPGPLREGINFMWWANFHHDTTAYVGSTGGWSYTGTAYLYDLQGNLLDTSSPGVGGQARFSQPGTAYPKGIYVQLDDGTTCYLFDPAENLNKCYAPPLTDTVDEIGDTIDFTLTKKNLLGKEYAIISVRDWVNGTEKKEGAFQVKLIGNPTNCYTEEGESGVTGTNFVPKMLFNWDWEEIDRDACDYTNSNYVYCDGVQFNISLFKKLAGIEQVINAGNIESLPSETAFYSYLIRDNFSKDLLDDFEEYYSSDFLSAGVEFQKIKKFITQNNLSYEVINTDGTISNGEVIPYGGLYRVEINITFIDPLTNSLFDGNDPNANIVVRLTPVQKAPNYNPLYEMPFDGEVGEKDGTYERNGYGTSMLNDDLRLNDNGIVATQYSGALKDLSLTKSSDLIEINKGTVLFIDPNNTFYFLPSQPTPVQMTITNNSTSTLNADYKMEGLGSDSQLRKKWNLISSSLGGTQCEDFSGNRNPILEETALAGGLKRLSWATTREGQIGLATVYLTPKNTEDTLRITPMNDAIMDFSSYDYLENATTMMLDNYGAKGITDYDSLQGLFDRIANEEMCMTNNKVDELKVWWHPDHLNELVDEVQNGSGYSCS